MANTPNELPLAGDFPKATREQWRELVQAVLKGAPFEQKLVARSYDGLSIEPLYARRAGAEPVLRRAPESPWAIMQRVDHPDPAAANAEALHELANGATGLALVFAGAVGSYGYGLAADAQGLIRVLDGIDLDAPIALDLDAGAQFADAASSIAELLRGRGAPPARAHIRFGVDPIGAAAQLGSAPLAWRDRTRSFSDLVSDLRRQGFRGPFAAADGRVIHNAGGSEAQELAFVLAVGVEYLRALEGSGTPLGTAHPMIYFRLAADADQFLTTAKFRALRKLWGRVAEACGLPPSAAVVTADTAWRMMGKRDPHVNVVRTTIAVVAAAFGGADAVTVLPFTLPLGLPDRFARRMARNTQLVLIEEASLARVADPTAGAGGIEALTEQLCRAGWGLFQEIERLGGAWAALERGLIQSKVGAVRAEHERAIARRSEVLTGSTDFPDLGELPVSVLQAAAPPVSSAAAAMELEPLRPLRLAEPFERLRDLSDEALARTGARPKAFLANLGRPSDFAGRATFAKNFFESGGIETAANDGFESHDELAAAFRRSQAKLACLCSSDQLYARVAADAAAALKSAGASHIYLVGRPGGEATRLREAGVETFIHAGCDALATLTSAHAMLANGTDR